MSAKEREIMAMTAQDVKTAVGKACEGKPYTAITVAIGMVIGEVMVEAPDGEAFLQEVIATARALVAHATKDTNRKIIIAEA